MSAADRAIARAVPAIPRPVVRRISGRYIAGETLKEAVSTVAGLNEAGCAATVDLLGERATEPYGASEKTAEYEKVLDELEREGLDSGISVKLTGIGLLPDYELCREHLRRIAARAARTGRFVRVDMEDRAQTEDTLRLVRDLHEEYPNTGAVVQACLRRSLEDVERLVRAGITARVCKGIYDEPRQVAYKDPEIVRESYAALVERYLRGGVYVGIATHDEYLVYRALRLIHELGVSADLYEFQMLLGVDEELRRILVEAGHRVRVYVPFGAEWYEYSTRRLRENPKIAGYVAKDVLESLYAGLKRRGAVQ